MAALRRTVYGLGSLLCGLGLVWSISRYPFERSWLAGILGAYLILLYRYPRCWLLVVPALLPVLDLAPVTGWFFIEELDLLLLITVAASYGRLARGKAPHGAHYAGAYLTLLLIMFLICLLALWRGLQPLAVPDINSLNNYLSPYNALRIAKGWCWAMLLLAPLRHDAGPELDGITRYVVPGMLAGLAMVCYANVRERVLFPGLLNFSSDYRSSAPFSAMHTGGAALDAYLALTLPLIGIWLRRPRELWRPITALLLLAAASYVGMATFSRGLAAAYGLTALLSVLTLLRAVPTWSWLLGAIILVPALNVLFQTTGYRGFAVGMLLLGLVLLRRSKERWQHLSSGVAMLLLLGLAIPYANGEYTAQRWATSAADLHLRRHHWQQVLQLMQPEESARWWGMGLGTFPRQYFWRNPGGEQPASYGYIDAANNRFLRLASANYPAGYGEMLRWLQRVALRPDHPYLLSFDMRLQGADAFLYPGICARQLLYPVNCLSVPRQHLSAPSGWQHVQLPIQSGPLASPTGLWQLPIQLEFAVEGSHTAVDLDNVSLRDLLNDHELVRNGDFNDANDYWFFSSDRHHLPWHIKNLWLNLYFEMGWPGLLCFASLMTLACAGLYQRWRGGESMALPWLASMLALLVVGLFDSLFDVPRVTLLALLLLSASQLRPGVKP